MRAKVFIIFGLLITVVHGRSRNSGRSIRGRRRDFRNRRQTVADNEIQGSAIDFSQAVLDPDTGLRCVIKEETVQSIEKEPILECKHKEVEKCHYTYVTQFTSAQEEVCDENFEKVCQITFKQQPMNETVKKCYRPLISVCNGQGKEICRTEYESSCTTKYIEKQPGKFVGDTRCDKLPIEICGTGCVTEEGQEECHDKTIINLVDVPEEICDLNPQKTCRLQTKLVPQLMPKHECTIIPQEMCYMKFTTPKLIEKPLMSKWCLDESPSPPGQTYAQALADPIGASSNLSPTRIPPAGPKGRGGIRMVVQDDFTQDPDLEEDGKSSVQIVLPDEEILAKYGTRI